MMSGVTHFYSSRLSLGIFFFLVLVATQFTFCEASNAQTQCKLIAIEPNQIYTEQGKQLLNDIVSCRLTSNEVDVILQTLGYKQEPAAEISVIHYFRYFKFGDTQPDRLEKCKLQIFGCFFERLLYEGAAHYVIFALDKSGRVKSYNYGLEGS